MQYSPVSAPDNNWRFPNLTYQGPYSFCGIRFTSLNETLAVMILFRPNTREPFFNEETQQILEMSEVLISQGLIKIRQKDTSNNSESEKMLDQQRRTKHDPADWWKRGENPPY